jgi:hypothetical protein
MPAAPPAPSSAPVLDFPLPHSPALDRPPGSGRRHAPETVAAVRLLYERTTLSYREIGRRTGTSASLVHGYALSGGWRRPPGAAKAPSLGTVALPSSALKGRALAKRLREMAERYLDEMERDWDVRSFQDCATVLFLLKEAKLLERRRRPRRPLAVRARAIAESWLDELEMDPQREPEALAWVLKMLEAARIEEAALKPTRPPKPVKETRIAWRRQLLEPSPHLPEVIERGRAAVAANRKVWRLGKGGPRRRGEGA